MQSFPPHQSAPEMSGSSYTGLRGRCMLRETMCMGHELSWQSSRRRLEPQLLGRCKRQPLLAAGHLPGWDPHLCTISGHYLQPANPDVLELA